MKRILVITYSQSGQLTDLVNSFVQPLHSDSEVDVTIAEIKPVTPYPYPWSFFEFLDVFPESVYLDGPEVEPLDLPDETEFDLIILSYQVWFLSPALPITGFLQTEEAARILKGKPVITLIGCRNMWLLGQEKMKKRLAELKAKLIDNVVLTDQGNSFATFITTPRWMLTGRKEGFWGLPPAGIADDEIANADRFGKALAKALHNDEEKEGKPLLQGLKAVEVNPRFILSESTAHRSFLIWGKLLRKAGKPGSELRRFLLLCYVTFLITFIITFIPITVVLKILLWPLIKRKLVKQKEYFESPSGSDDSRMSEFTD